MTAGVPVGSALLKSNQRDVIALDDISGELFHSGTDTFYDGRSSLRSGLGQVLVKALQSELLSVLVGGLIDTIGVKQQDIAR